jgi:hypothetical protein
MAAHRHRQRGRRSDLSSAGNRRVRRLCPGGAAARRLPVAAIGNHLAGGAKPGPVSVDRCGGGARSRHAGGAGQSARTAGGLALFAPRHPPRLLDRRLGRWPRRRPADDRDVAGRNSRHAVQRVETRGELAELAAGGSATALLAAGNAQWIGRRDGRVEFCRATEKARLIIPPPAEIAGSRDRRVLALAAQPKGPYVAAGFATGRLAIIDAEKATLVANMDEADELRVAVLAFDPDGKWLAAGTGARNVLLVDLKTSKITARHPKFEGGVLALSFGRDGALSVVDGYGRLTTLSRRHGEFQRTASYVLPGLLVSAAFDRDGDWLAVGDGGGRVHVFDRTGGAVSFGSACGHSDAVTALTFGANADTLVSASSNGTIAIWDLAGGAGLSTPIPSFSPEPSALRVAADGALVAAASVTGAAGVWRLDDGADA